MSAHPPFSAPSFRPTYVPTQRRARLVVILLIANAALSLISALTAVFGLFFPLPAEGEEVAEPIGLLVALLQVGIAVLHFVVYVATVVVFLMWMYRSYENLPSFGVPPRDLKYSSGWAVGSFFVPFVSLVVPYRAMKELWNKSVPDTGTMFSDLSPPAFFPLWWAVWLISNFANQLHLRLELQGNIAPETSYILTIVIGFIDILAAVLALSVVREINEQQVESSKLVAPELLNHQSPPMPPTFDPLTS